MAPRVRVGTTGWSFPEWKGPFYPPDVAEEEMLPRYARVSDLVEVNSFYYRMLPRQVIQRWARATPPGFLFTPKMSGAITHEKLLRGAEEDLARYFEAIAPLREAGKLGPVLVELPPHFTYEAGAADLDAFLAAVPPWAHAAVELRNATWWRPETYRMLEARGATLVWSETKYGHTPAVLTSDRAYLRLIGDRDAQPGVGRRVLDRRGIMEYWVKRLLDEGRSAREILALLNNSLEGFAPESMARFAAMLGLPPVDLGAAKAGAVVPPGQRTFADFG